MRAVRSVLVSAWVGSTNIGDELVFSSLVRKLHARDISITAVSIDAETTERDHEVRAIGHVDLRAQIGVLSRVDAVILGGGGLLQDTTSPWNLPYHLARPVVARRRGRRVAAIGIGAGPLDRGVGRWLVRRGLRDVRPITVRDDHSRDLLADVGIQARTTADLAFGLDPVAAGPADCLVACLRPWSGARHLLPAGIRRSNVPEWFVDEAAAALDRAATALGVPVHFVALQRDRDHRVHEQIAGRMHSTVTFATPNVRDVLREISRGAVVVSMRYHGIVGATLAGRPSVAIGYAPKVDALAVELGAASRLVPWSPRGLASVADAAQDVAPHSEDAQEGRELLRARERGNDDAIDELLSG